MLGFVNQKNNEVKNKEKPRSYGKDHSEVKVEVKDKVKELAGQANLTLSKGVTKKVPDVQFKKPEMNKGETHCSWQNIFTGLNNEIKVRHYSPKTLKSYTIWARKFQGFTKSKNPEALSPSDVKEFLTFLAVKQVVFPGQSPDLCFR